MDSKNASRQVLAIPAFRHFLIARFCMNFAVNMFSTVIMWQVYELTKNNFAVGLIGLAEFIPFFIVTFFAGYLADIWDRKRIILICLFTYSLCVLVLFFLTGAFADILKNTGVGAIYSINFIIGLIRGFLSPSQSAISAQLVPKEHYAHSSNWLNLGWHIGAVGGPAAAGLCYAFIGANLTYAIIFFLVFAASLLMTLVPKQPLSQQKQEPVFKSLGAGIRYVSNHQIILGSLSLDMFAVFFGGAVAMIPGFAAEVLHIGASGAGFLRTAPAIGAIVMGIVMTKYPPKEKAGRNLLWAVAGFGVSTILFAFSTNFYLSFFALALTGLFDNVSMAVRGTIISLFAPDEMRGRISAVNSIFIGSSNELGAFESGVASMYMGLVPSVAFGGAMTLLVVALLAKVAPKLRDLSFE
jgi:MFS family permease